MIWIWLAFIAFGLLMLADRFRKTSMTMRTRKPSFSSTEECFEAAEELMARLEQKAHREAANELREGFACLNGLTDGWDLFLASIERIQAVAAERFDPEDRRALEALREAAHAAIHRR